MEEENYMFEEINKELEELKQGINRLKKTESMLDSLRSTLSQLETKNMALKTALEKEELDVENLSKKNLTTIFYTILGSKEKQLEKERQEALAVRLKYEDNLKQIDDLQYQISKLIEEQKQFRNSETLYNQLYGKKYDMLKESGNKEFHKIMELEDSILSSKANLKEIKEAISAGNRVMDKITSAQKSLDSAEGWGTWDLIGGGGLITNIVKHSHIDDAKEAASEIQSLLNNFKTELADIKIDSEIQINIEGFTKFADFFLDGLIFDWVVQSRIHDSMDSVQKVKGEVETVLRKLSLMQNSIENTITNRTTQLSEFIETAK
jgi:hypothetical protein